MSLSVRAAKTVMSQLIKGVKMADGKEQGGAESFCRLSLFYTCLKDELACMQLIEGDISQYSLHTVCTVKRKFE